ncbi:MAG: WYL domain-containing protein [Clostridia bacterium]
MKKVGLMLIFLFGVILNAHNQIFKLIRDAILNKCVIEFSYFNSYGKNAKRIVEPLKLYFRYNSWYLCGFDKEKKIIASLN